MKREDIIRMAREADIDWHKHWNDDESNRLEVFATLVAAALRDEMWEKAMKLVAEAVASEREACAKVCDAEAQSREEAAHKTHGAGSPAYGRQMAGVNAAKNCAAAIRARGQA